jgi:hypothetical protein
MPRARRALLAVIAGFTGLAALGSALTPAVAQYYYESNPQHYYEDDIRVAPRRGYGQPQGYYQQPPQGYYQQQPGYYQQQPRGYAPQYYNKDAAKDYWREQKEAQKRAIKRGYYVQPQAQQYAPQAIPNYSNGAGIPPALNPRNRESYWRDHSGN